MRCFIVLALFLVFLGCEEQKPNPNVSRVNNIEVEFLFEKDGCRVYEFYRNGNYVYFTDCRGTIGYDYKTSALVGKTVTYTEHHIHNQIVK